MYPKTSGGSVPTTPSTASATGRPPRQKVLLCAGLGGILFIALFVILGVLTPGYRFGKDTISALELTPFGWVQRLNFWLFGASLLAFAVGLRRELAPGRGSVSIPLLQMLSGAGVVGAGIFIQPPLHVAFDLLAFNSALAVLIMFVWYFGDDPAWRGWRTYSALSALTMMCLLAGFGAANHGGGPAGLFEKLATATRVLWSTLLVLKLLNGSTLKRLS